MRYREIGFLSFLREGNRFWHCQNRIGITIFIVSYSFRCPRFDYYTCLALRLLYYLACFILCKLISYLDIMKPRKILLKCPTLVISASAITDQLRLAKCFKWRFYFYFIVSLCVKRPWTLMSTSPKIRYWTQWPNIEYIKSLK